MLPRFGCRNQRLLLCCAILSPTESSVPNAVATSNGKGDGNRRNRCLQQGTIASEISFAVVKQSKYMWRILRRRKSYGQNSQRNRRQWPCLYWGPIAQMTTIAHSLCNNPPEYWLKRMGSDEADCKSKTSTCVGCLGQDGFEDLPAMVSLVATGRLCLTGAEGHKP